MKIYYAYGSWFDGGVDVGYFTTPEKAIEKLEEFIEKEQYTHDCFVIEIELDEYLREYRQSRDGGFFWCHKDRKIIYEKINEDERL